MTSFQPALFETEEAAAEPPETETVLTRKDILDLIRMCDREVSYTGISDPAGKRCLELKAKLKNL